ncbi:threonine dehydratase [Natronocella acetinitrilica]|uniref:Threonine dehydratase n=1 Tax=Natronocella acetinitrilica TaxID=414046 RepID=A0AAE3G5E5_9GAMM|nr:threonine ammonia-lyase [Natronocella acetinitrilica]MCP1676225.1 threonine dehydratase [Natronocella acetinitrilica]
MKQTDAAPTVAAIRKAATRISGQVMRTGCELSETLSDITGATIYLKFENHQFTAAFKERGALNRLLLLDEAQRNAGVIAMSAGNHAQAVAYHAERLGISATIVMPRHTPTVKVQNTRRHGAAVVLEGETVAEAGDIAQKLAGERGLTFVHPYDDPAVIAGQGTIGLEFLEDVPALDTLVVPIGGGGLIAGIATAARAVKPDIDIVGVQSERFPAVHQALAGEPIHCGRATIADGIAVKRPGLLTLPIIRRLVDEVLLVSEHSLEQAILYLLEIEKTVVEGAGAAGLAAVLLHPQRFRGRRVGLILCGGNIDLLPLSSVIQRGLIRTSRISRIRVGIPDVPGALAHLTTLLARLNANVIQIAHQRAFTDLSLRAAEVEVTIETLGVEHKRDVLTALEAEGYDTVTADAEPHPEERYPPGA